MTKTTERDGADGREPILVGVTSSAANTQSLLKLLECLPPQAGMALVLVLQNRELLDEAAFAERVKLAGHRLTPIVDDLPVEAGRTYFPPGNTILTVQGGRFHVADAQDQPGGRGTIDSFLVSLAEDEDRRSVAVVLAGTGVHGTLGFKTVKEAGGLTLAEESDRPNQDDLSSSNSPSALADAILPIEQLAERIASSVRQLYGHDLPTLGLGTGETEAGLAAVAAILRNRTGHDFHGYKPGTFLRRVQRRMQVTQTESLEHYVELMRAQNDEAQQLFNDLLIGVTQFFRDPKEFELLEREIVPKLFANKSRSDQLRVWVIGCSTGEEAYSLGILLREHMAGLTEVPQVQIFATDLDGRALAAARSARYTETIAEAMSPERLTRWFVREGNTYCVVKELREMCIFSQHSIVKDAPFSRLDLVSCRNLLIYLDGELQSRVIPLFHFALKAEGVLFLGNSENVSRHTNLFSPMENRSRIFRRLDTGTRTLPNFPFAAVDRRSPSAFVAVDQSRQMGINLARRAERFAERYAPAYVIVDEAYCVLHFSGRTGRYIDPAGGAASLNLLQLVHTDLRLELRAALARAAESDETVTIEGLRMGHNGHRLAVDLVVEPVRDGGGAPSFVVLFKDAANTADPEGGSVSSHLGEDAYAKRLEAELRNTKDRLQATIEELESTNEELKSSNEEYQSLNEELQSANEELETSKEELQSVNEELTTVNGELGHRVNELTRATSDLKNFLESTQIATVFLDNELRVTNYTPAVTEVFHLVESDAGRPIAHIKSLIAYDDLQDDVRRVLRTLGTVEREIENAITGALYLVRVLPYRSVDNFIAGVVVTFVDVTARKRAEEALRDREERLRAIVENARDYAIFTTDREGRIQEWLPGAVAVFGWTAEEAAGRDAAMLYTAEDRQAHVPEQEFALAESRGWAPNVRWHERKDGTRVFIEGTTRRLRDGAGRPRGFMKIGQDITERRRSEQALRESEAAAKLLLGELQHRVRNTLAVVRSITRRTMSGSVSVEDYAAHLSGRIDAFARVQSAVARDPQAGVDLEQLIAQELQAHAAREGQQVTRIAGPAVRLMPKAAEILGLTVHELSTNAVKYGALSVEGGRVEVGWEIEAEAGPSRLVIVWSETGVQLDGTAPRRRGFGTELIERTLNYDLGADTSLRFEPDGLRCVISVPCTDRLIARTVGAEDPD